jgi:signal transduction histidine kinase
VAGLVNDVASTVRAIAEANGNALTVITGPGLGDAYVDATKLRQCLLNLAGNACKFTSEGEVVVAARRERVGDLDRVIFTVSDTGIGIAPEHAARIFEPFTQIDGSHQRRFSGSGLGLAITRELARLMGGDVELAPSHGRGAVFRLWAPAGISPRSEAGSESAAHAA